MANIHVFTSIAGNYLPKARVLFESISALHPEWQCHLLLVEDWSSKRAELAGEPYSVCQLGELDIPNWRPWAFCHDLVELCTAVKPFMLQRLLARSDCDAVLYFDPDILLFSRLDDVVDALAQSSVLLTPHQTTPESTMAGIIGNEMTSLLYGSYNLGFIGVASDSVGSAFAQWWCDRLYHFCRDDPARGLFTDQRWIDLVPSLFDRVGILRSTRLNVAAWNWNHRSLSQSTDGDFLVNGEPLGFYHFTGIDSGNHALMLEKFPAQRAVVEALLSRYRESIAGQARQHHSDPWSFRSLASGEPVNVEWRRAYLSSPALQERFPDPWGLTAQVWEQLVKDTPPKVEANDGGTYVSLGYQSGRLSWDTRRIASHLWRAFTNPALGWKMVSHMRGVLSREGFAGIRRRLSKTG
jgi:hypothetical protein